MAEDFSDAFIISDTDNIVRICMSCDREQHLDQKKLVEAGWSLSHGICVRHIYQMYKMAGFDDEKIKGVIKKSEDSPDFKGHCRDLSDPKNKPFLDWLKEPKLSPKKQSEQQKAA